MAGMNGYSLSGAREAGDGNTSHAGRETRSNVDVRLQAVSSDRPLHTSEEMIASKVLVITHISVRLHLKHIAKYSATLKRIGIEKHLPLV
jgi:hypothetical protein